MVNIAASCAQPAKQVWQMLYLVTSHPPSTHQDCQNAEDDRKHETHAAYHNASNPASSPVRAVIVVSIVVPVLQQLTSCSTGVRLGGFAALQITDAKVPDKLPVI